MFPELVPAEPEHPNSGAAGSGAHGAPIVGRSLPLSCSASWDPIFGPCAAEATRAPDPRGASGRDDRRRRATSCRRTRARSWPRGSWSSWRRDPRTGTPGRVRRVGARGHARRVPDRRHAGYPDAPTRSCSRRTPTRSPPYSPGATSGRWPIVPAGGGTGARGRRRSGRGRSFWRLNWLNRVRSFDPELWRIHVEAGLRNGPAEGDLVRDGGLMFAPDPGAPEQSAQIGGKIATNAGGPHAFRLRRRRRLGDRDRGRAAPGGAGLGRRPDPQGRRRVRPEAAADWFRGDARDRHRRLAQAAPRSRGGTAGGDLPPGLGARAARRCRPSLASGIVPGGAELLDAETLGVRCGVVSGRRARGAQAFCCSPRRTAPGPRPSGCRPELWLTRPASGAVGDRRAAGRAVWAGRGSLAVAFRTRIRDRRSLGGAVSSTERHRRPARPRRGGDGGDVAIGRRHGLVALCFGHAGDGTLHSAFSLAGPSRRAAPGGRSRSTSCSTWAVRLGGSVSGEHGLGLLKRGGLARQWPPR